jgi:SET domain-containing protein
MFTYSVEVKPANNPAMGLGLFAKEFIPNQSIVWQYIKGIDIRFPIEKLNELNKAQKEYFQVYGWIEQMANDEKPYYYCNADNTSFINHSKNSNISSRGDYSIATRDIEIGQEIFIDYSEFDAKFNEYEKTFV